MTTFVVSIGWITAEATLPESEPMMKGLPYFYKKLSEDIFRVGMIEMKDFVDLLF